MITTAQAAAFRAQYIAALPNRIDEAIKQAAVNGASSLTISYAPASDAQAQAFRTNEALPAGWANTTVNTTDKTITFAP